ncbi:MAG: hypothetical protein AAFO68_03245, partial [Pseudomonadota bacterium]
AASLAVLDKQDEAAALVTKLRRLDPDYATSAMDRAEYPLPSDLSRDVVHSALHRAGLLFR